MATSIRPCVIQAAVWSPCSRFIAIAWDGETTIEILDPITLERVYTLECPQAATRSLVFSSDSRLLTCCGERPNQFITSWDLQTGGAVNTIWTERAGSLTERFCIAYSTDRKMIGVLYQHMTAATLCVFDTHSGTRTDSHSLERNPTDAIWMHGESFRFAVVQRWSVTIWELEFASGAVPTEVEVFSTPGTPDPTKCVWFPPLHRLAFTVKDIVSVWDARKKKLLLYDPSNVKGPSKISFSPDGRFFACGTTAQDLYLWKETSAGYTPHRMFASSFLHPTPLVSSDARSVIAYAREEIQLWRLGGSAASLSLSGFSAPFSDNTEFIVEFSPDGAFVAVARREGRTVTVFDLKSGVQRLIIDAVMAVYGLKAVDNTIVVFGTEQIVTWNLPTEDHAIDTKVNTRDSIQAIPFRHRRPIWAPCHASISSDLRQIVFTEESSIAGIVEMYVYDVSTGATLAKAKPSGQIPWFAPEGREIWCDGIDRRMEGWIVFKENPDGSNVELWPIEPPEEPPKECPWRSSRGYRVMEDGWV